MNESHDSRFLRDFTRKWKHTKTQNCILAQTSWFVSHISCHVRFQLQLLTNGVLLATKSARMVIYINHQWKSNFLILFILPQIFTWKNHCPPQNGVVVMRSLSLWLFCYIKWNIDKVFRISFSFVDFFQTKKFFFFSQITFLVHSEERPKLIIFR